MSEARRPDPDRLEAGLRELRELGYLRTPASTYVARRAGAGRSTARAVLVSSLWIGAGTGLTFALLMVIGALVSDPGLLAWPRSVVVLFVDLALVLSFFFALLTGLFSSAVLWTHRRGDTIRGSFTERAFVLLPGLLGTAYLVDRIGRTLLEGARPVRWAVEAVLLVALSAFFATVLTGAMRGALAMVRLQLHGAFRPRPVSGRERMLPAAVGAALSVLLLAVGPYRPGDRTPWFDEVTVGTGGTARPVLVVGLDGMSGPEALGGLGPLEASVARPDPGLAPTAFWNEISTGFSARDHGLASPSTPAPRGWSVGGERLREDPVLGTLLTRLMPGVGLTEQLASDRRDLRRPPVWEIAAQAGLRSRVVNWWGTYPAARAPGLEVVSDRQWLRHSAGIATDSLLAAPPYLLLDDASFDALRDSFLDRLAPFAALLDSLGATAETRKVFALAATSDLYHLERVREAAVPAGPELVVVLLSGPDFLARAAGPAPGALQRLRAAYERFLAGEIASLAAGTERELWLLAVGRDHEGTVTGTWGRGPWPVRPAATAARILGRMGIAPAADMVGVLPGPDTPRSYGLLRPGATDRARVAPDLEQLRSLGYIGD